MLPLVAVEFVSDASEGKARSNELCELMLCFLFREVALGVGEEGMFCVEVETR